jgi:hypothetical protein
MLLVSVWVNLPTYVPKMLVIAMRAEQSRTDLQAAPVADKKITSTNGFFFKHTILLCCSLISL